jgi:hypothetical protein
MIYEFNPATGTVAPAVGKDAESQRFIDEINVQSLEYDRREAAMYKRMDADGPYHPDDALVLRNMYNIGCNWDDEPPKSDTEIEAIYGEYYAECKARRDLRPVAGECMIL